MENYNFEVDEDTIIVLNIISRFLKKYFKYHSDDDVIAAINNFYSKRRPDFSDKNEMDFIDLYFHHDHPFIVAGNIHFQNNTNLQQQYSDVVSWLRDIKWWKIPAEAAEEYRIWSREAYGKL